MRVAKPYLVFTRKNSPFYYVKYYDSETGSYTNPITTKQTTKALAEKTAKLWYREGIPQKDGVQDIQDFMLWEQVRKEKLTKQDADRIIKELQHQGIVKSVIYTQTEESRNLIDFLTEFWDWEKSPYIKEKQRKHHGIGKAHVYKQAMNVKKYWQPRFNGLLLGEITKRHIDSLITDLENSPLSHETKNTIIRTGTTAFKWAYGKELINRDISTGFIFFTGKSKERQILTPEMARSIFALQWKDERAKLANMLAMVTGLRSGEIRALKLKDIGEGCLYINHSWNYQDGLKGTKNGESRIVQVPFPSIMNALHDLAEMNNHGQGLDGYVFFATLKHKPIDGNVFVEGLRESLMNIGMGEENAKDYTFHAWRHYFTTYLMDKVSNKVLQKQTGHKTLAMLEHYGSHKAQGETEVLMSAQVEMFGDLLPIDFDLKEGVQGVAI